MLKLTLKLVKQLSLVWVNFHLDVMLTVWSNEHKSWHGAPSIIPWNIPCSYTSTWFFKRQSGGKVPVWWCFGLNYSNEEVKVSNSKMLSSVVWVPLIHPCSRKRIGEPMANGVLAGYPMVDIKAKLLRWFIPMSTHLKLLNCVSCIKNTKTAVYPWTNDA